MGIHFRTSQRVSAPPQTVAAAIADIDEYGLWMPNLVRIERLTEENFGVGTRWRETRRMFGREATEEFEVRVWEPGERLELFVDGRKGSSRRGEFRFVYTFAGDGDSTELSLDASIDNMGLLGNLLGKLMVKPLVKAVERDHAALKSYVEGGAEPHPSAAD